MFRIGEFSKIAQVSGRQLRFYEQIGLLKPEHSDPQSGYRFYTAAQLPRLNRILALKELGFTLEEISPMLDNEISPDELRGMLTLKRAQVAHTVQEETARLKLIESRIEQIDCGNDPAAVDMVIKSVPMQSYLSVRTVSADMAAGYALFQRVMTEVPRAVNANCLGPLTVVMHLEPFEWEQMDIEIGFVLQDKLAISVTLSDGKVLTVNTLHALPRAATSVRVGPIETGHGSYQAIGRWIEVQHMRLDGPAREVILEPPTASSDMVTEIQVPIAAAN